MNLRVRLIAADPVRRQVLAGILAQAGHALVANAPDVLLCDGVPAPPLADAEVPALVLADHLRLPHVAGLLPRAADPRRIDLALRAVAAGLTVRAAAPARTSSWLAPADDDSPLTPRETEILRLVGEGLSNKAVARRLGISVHTVKFHLEALFAKLEASSRAEAVAKGLRGGVIEL